MNGTLSNQSIAKAIDELRDQMQHTSWSSKKRTRMLLLTEEILLLYHDEFGTSPSFELCIKKVFGKEQLFIAVQSPSFDYREHSDEGDALRSFIAQHELLQTWKYRKGRNTIHIVPTHNNQVSDIVKLLLGVAAAVVFIATKAFLPDGLVVALSEVIFPKFATILGAVLRMFAGAMIFFSILQCILSFGNMRELKQITRNVFSRVALNLTFVTLFTSIPILFLFQFDKSSMDFNWESLFNLFTDMIPPDFITPFIEGNMIQISLIALIVGGTIVALSLQSSILGQTIILLQNVSQALMELFCKILPFFVFVNLVSALSGTSLASVIQVILPVVIGIVTVILLCIIESVEFGLLHRFSIIDFIKNSLPGAIVGLTTASTAAALPAIRQDLLKIGVDDSDISFLLPLEQAFYKPSVLVLVIPGVIAVYRIFAIQPTMSSYISLLIVAMIIALASPPVPGGVLSCLTILCSQLGLPDGSLAILILIATIMDYFAGFVSSYSFHAEVAGISFRKNRKKQDSEKTKEVSNYED